MIFRYNKILTRINDSQYRSCFKEAKIRGKVYYFPIKKINNNLELRNLAVLSIIPYLLWVSQLLYNKYKRSDVLFDKEDIFQECFILALKNFKVWDPQKSRFTFFVFNICIWALSNKLKREAKQFVKRSFSYLFKNYPDVDFDKILGETDGDFYIDPNFEKIEKEILWKKFLKSLEKKLTEKEYLIFRSRVIENNSYRSIGKRLNISKQYVHSIVVNSIRDKIMKNPHFRELII